MGALENMKLIQSLFTEAKELVMHKNPTVDPADFLLAQSGGFTSVAFEGAAMGIALTNISEWFSFCEIFGDQHDSQIHVGLGWAICESGENLEVLDSLSSEGRWKAIDGYGYYMGLFKRREAIREQTIPEFFSGDDLRAFNQGLGRSLWYLSQANSERLFRMIDLFAENRKPDMWRGVGVALTYVGGVAAQEVLEINQIAKNHSVHLRCGALFALKGRDNADCNTPDSSLVGETLRVNDHKLLALLAAYQPDYGGFIDSLESTLSAG
ncbi:MAG: DUF1702 family protein [Crocinitomicaceae bacterium]|nr:DUF1702 family protein [Crocinitomicaceae bacterium]